MSHTPTPWSIAPTHFGTPWNIEGPNGENIALVLQLTPPHSNPAQADRHANARLVVERVNGWDKLVAERDALRAALRKAMDGHCDGRTFCGSCAEGRALLEAQ